MAAQVRTARGAYLLKLVAAPEHSGDRLGLTIALDRADGIERVAFRCVIADELLSDDDRAEPEDVPARLAPWFEAEFEQLREAALKTIRSERRLLEIVLDAASPGPFKRV